MTKEQIIKALTDYAEQNELFCQFEEAEEEEGVTSWRKIEISKGIMKGERIGQLIFVGDEGDMISSIDLLYEFKKDRVADVEAFLEYMEETDNLFSYDYVPEDQILSVYINYSYGEADVEELDEDMLEMFFFAPLTWIEKTFRNLIAINKGCSVDEAIEKMMAEDDEEYEKAADNKERFRDVRYYFEHRLLPNLFYKDMENLTNELLENKGEILHTIMCNVCEENYFLMPYNVEEYKVYFDKVGKDCKIIRIVMPEPTETPLCFEVYMIFDNQCTNGMYFTVERGESVKMRFLCAWDSEGGHGNYGECNKDTGAIKKRIVQVFGVEK